MAGLIGAEGPLRDEQGGRGRGRRGCGPDEEPWQDRTVGVLGKILAHPDGARTRVGAGILVVGLSPVRVAGCFGWPKPSFHGYR